MFLVLWCSCLHNDSAIFVPLQDKRTVNIKLNSYIFSLHICFIFLDNICLEWCRILTSFVLATPQGFYRERFIGVFLVPLFTIQFAETISSRNNRWSSDYSSRLKKKFKQTILCSLHTGKNFPKCCPRKGRTGFVNHNKSGLPEKCFPSFSQVHFLIPSFKKR